MDAGEDFATRIVVKTNFAEVLRRELARPAWKGERVSLGTATDPYQPCEGRYRITRRALEALRERRNPLSVVTKSTLVLRDRDVLADLARTIEVAVYFSITTLDPTLWRAVEPGTPPPLQRLAVLRRLVDAGVPCGVFMAPILPGITNSAESIEAVARAAKEHGAGSFWTSALRLVPLVKEHYLGFVGERFPALVPRYERGYAGANAPRDYLSVLEARVGRVRAAYGFGDEPVSRRPSMAAPAARPIAEPEQQLPLPL